MKYEVHFTVEPQEGRIPPIGVGKVVDLDLDTPYPNRQLMVGRTGEFETQWGAILWADSIQRDLQNQGWKVVRRKMETPMMEGWVKYREAHWKIPISSNKEAVELDRFRYQFNFLLSYSRIQSVVYLSARNYGIFYEADMKFNKLNEHVQRVYPETKVHFENVLEDTNEHLDWGWVV